MSLVKEEEIKSQLNVTTFQRLADLALIPMRKRFTCIGHINHKPSWLKKLLTPPPPLQLGSRIALCISNHSPTKIAFFTVHSPHSHLPKTEKNH